MPQSSCLDFITKRLRHNAFLQFAKVLIYCARARARLLRNTCRARPLLARRLMTRTRHRQFADCKHQRYNPWHASSLLHHSALIPEPLMIGHHFSASAFTSAPSGDPKSEPPDVWRLLWCLSRVSRSGACRRSGNVPGCLATPDSG